MRRCLRQRFYAHTANLWWRCLVYLFHNVKHMLGEFEHLVLLAVLRLKDDAYGATIRRDIETRVGRELSISATYVTLERLEGKGLVRSRIGEPTAERGGRRRRHYALTMVGRRALAASHRAYRTMAEGLEEELERS